MTTLVLRRPRSFWSFEGTPDGASNDAVIVPQEQIRLLLGFADGSATGIARIGDPIQTIYDVHRESESKNWNGAGAEPISLQTAHRAKKLFLALPSYRSE